jgi:hypothetical protein
MTQRTFVRTADTVRLHHRIDADAIIRAGGGTAYTGSVRVARNGVVSVYDAAAAIALLDNVSANATLVPDVAGL